MTRREECDRALDAILARGLPLAGIVPTQGDAPAAPKAGPRLPAEMSTLQNQEDAPPCNMCGAIMVRSGSCYKCVNCGETSGCS